MSAKHCEVRAALLGLIALCAACSACSQAETGGEDAGAPTAESRTGGAGAPSSGGAGGARAGASSVQGGKGGSPGSPGSQAQGGRGASTAQGGRGGASSPSRGGSGAAPPVQGGGGSGPSQGGGGGAASSSAGAGAAAPSSSGGAVASAGAGVAGAGGADAAQAGQPAAGAGSTKPSSWRIAFLGDSITETSCTSQLVHSALRAEGITNIDLVGTKQNQQGCGVDDPDRDVEGHSGYLVTRIVGDGENAAELPMWCAADRADLVLMHFGTNDAWNGAIPIPDVVSAYTDVLAALRAVQPHVILLVAQIIPLSPDGCPACEQRVRDINAQIPMWAAAESTAESPVYVVDQWTGFDPGTDAYDRVHPNMQGSQKMADVWLAALRAQKIF